MSRNLALIALTITLAASAAACTSTVDPVVEEAPPDVEQVSNAERSDPPAKPIDTGVKPMKEGQQDGTSDRPGP